MYKYNFWSRLMVTNGLNMDENSAEVEGMQMWQTDDNGPEKKTYYNPFCVRVAIFSQTKSLSS